MNLKTLLMALIANPSFAVAELVGLRPVHTPGAQGEAIDENAALPELSQMFESITNQVAELKAELEIQAKHMAMIKLSKAELTNQVTDLKAELKIQVEQMAAIKDTQDTDVIAEVAEEVFESHHVNETIITIVEEQLASRRPPAAEEVGPPLHFETNFMTESYAGPTGSWCYSQKIAGYNGNEAYMYKAIGSYACRYCVNGEDCSNSIPSVWKGLNAYHITFWCKCT